MNVLLSYIVLKQSFIITHLLNDILFLANIDNYNFQCIQEKDTKSFIKQLSKSRDENSVILRKILQMPKKNNINLKSFTKIIMDEKIIKKYKKEKLKRKYFNFPKYKQYKNGFKKNYR